MPGHKGSHSVRVDREVLDLLDSVAEAMDVNTTALTNAALLGLLRAGQIERFVDAAAQASPEVAASLEVRRPRVSSRKWVTTSAVTEVDPTSGRKVPHGRAAEWEHGPFRLRYVGNPRRAKAKIEGEGWHLFGPGQPAEGRQVGWVREDATERANFLVDRWFAAQGSPGPDAHAGAPDAGAGKSAPDLVTQEAP